MSSDGGYPTPYPGAPRRARRALPADWEELPETQDFDPPDALVPAADFPTPDPYGIEEFREPTGVLRLPPLDPEDDEPTVALAGYGRRTPSGVVITPPLPLAASDSMSSSGHVDASGPVDSPQPVAAPRPTASPQPVTLSESAPPTASSAHEFGGAEFGGASNIQGLRQSGEPLPQVSMPVPAGVPPNSQSSGFGQVPVQQVEVEVHQEEPQVAPPVPLGPPRPRPLRQDPRTAAVIAEASGPVVVKQDSLPVSPEASPSITAAADTVDSESDLHSENDSHDSGDGGDGEEPQDRPRWVGWLIEALIIVVGAMVLTSVLRLFVYQTFNVPTGSMEHTIDTGDSIIAVKLLDFERGDVVVFEDPGDWLRGAKPEEPTGVRKALEWVGLLPSTATQHLVKRVIGMPGDHVVCCDLAGRITVNGVALVEDDYLFSSNGVAVAPSDLRFDVIVPKDRIFVMGDHRNESADSRVHLCEVSVGQPQGMAAFVPIDKVVGPVVAITGPWDKMARIRVPETFSNVPQPGPAPDTPSIIGPCQ